MAPGGCELIVVRHGETCWNSEQRWQGHCDSDLTPLGRKQASAIGERLASVSFEALYSSDLPRAMGTAAAIAERAARQIIPEPRLRERKLGIFEGLTLAEIKQRYPQHASDFRSGDPDWAMPEGESLRQRHERAIACLTELAARHNGKRIVAVTHGGVLDSVIRHCLGLTLEQPRHWRLYNASLNVVHIEGPTWTLATWGDIAHLAAAGSLDDY